MTPRRIRQVRINPPRRPVRIQLTTGPTPSNRAYLTWDAVSTAPIVYTGAIVGGHVVPAEESE